MAQSRFNFVEAICACLAQHQNHEPPRSLVLTLKLPDSARCPEATLTHVSCVMVSSANCQARQGSGSGVIGARESKSGFAGGAYEWEQVLVLEGFGRELSKSREGCWDVGTGVKENKLQ